jgi:hypothetical protein
VKLSAPTAHDDPAEEGLGLHSQQLFKISSSPQSAHFGPHRQQGLSFSNRSSHTGHCRVYTTDFSPSDLANQISPGRSAISVMPFKVQKRRISSTVRILKRRISSLVLPILSTFQRLSAPNLRPERLLVDPIKEFIDSKDRRTGCCPCTPRMKSCRRRVVVSSACTTSRPSIPGFGECGGDTSRARSGPGHPASMAVANSLLAECC